MKKRYLTYILLLMLFSANAEENSTTYDVHKKILIPEVTVYGKRPLKEIGIQQTKLDSVVLKENIALSMADVLTFNTPIFVKSYGRATLSTVSFRGTSPSHTQVTWNGMRLNNPMLGMTDFSMIPSYFIDKASLLHGTSSVNETGGGLGGAIKLSTSPAEQEGFGLQFVQGIGSFYTFDDFLRLSYGNEHWQTSTRVVFSTSKNNYKFRNHDKKINVYDDDMNIVEQYYPIERNKSGEFKDLHLLQEVYYNNKRGDRFGLNAWYIYSNRELPMLTVDHGDDTDFDNRQREHTFRSVFSYDHLAEAWKVSANAGYIYTWMAYDYKRDLGNGVMAHMTRSRSKIHTIYGKVEGEYHLHKKWLFMANLSAHQHFVESRDKNVILQSGDKGIVGYRKARIELSGSASVKWQPIDRLGMSVVVREELYGKNWTPVIPAFFIDGVLSKKGNLMAKASVSRNFRFPTLNDLYFLPGGNPELKQESGWTYDAGLSFAVGKKDVYSLSGSATWFDSYINDWIIWLPTTKGFFSPDNIKDVHAYGVELQADLNLIFPKDWRLGLNGTFSWTPSINQGEPRSPADQSVGKQLPYIPLLSSTINGRLSWRCWTLSYKWCYYSERFTMSSNDLSLTGKLPPYFMSNLSLEKLFLFRWADLSLKGTINNLFDEEYLSVLSRPMPGINFEFFVGITPKW
ncbi:MAG: TonB-dependent receptor [Paludibacteraceae bacterium]|nr:TonB-dependent receptor [Paludibacteraceae bacterium]